MVYFFSFAAGPMLFCCEKETKRYLLLGRINTKRLLCAHFYSFIINNMLLFLHITCLSPGIDPMVHGQKRYGHRFNMCASKLFRTNMLNFKLFYWILECLSYLIEIILSQPYSQIDLGVITCHSQPFDLTSLGMISNSLSQIVHYLLNNKYSKPII